MPKKWDDSTPAGKILKLYTTLLYNEREYSLKEISELLDCSKQTAIRLLEKLEEARYGKVNAWTRGRESIYCMDRPPRLPGVSLDAAGLSQLALCRDFLIHLLPKAMRNDLDKILRQATAFLPAGERIKSVPGGSLTKGHIDYTPFQDILETIIAAIQMHCVCEVKYKANALALEKKYHYAPMRMEAYHESILIYGWVVTDAGEVKAIYDKPSPLALQRIVDIELTDRKSLNLPQPQELTPGAFGIVEEKAFMAEILFKPEVATYVSERIWSKKQHLKWNEDRTLLLKLEVRSKHELISWVLSFADKAELLAPENVRAEITAKIATLSGIYSKKYKQDKADEVL